MIERLPAVAFAVLLILAAPVLGASPGWTLKRQAETPVAYAMIEWPATNLNIRAVVLACEVMDRRKVLQLQLYPARPEPLLPNGASRNQLKDQPRAQIEIDGTIWPIIFDAAGDYAVLQDDDSNGVAALSPAMVERLENGRSMTVHFDLLKEPPGRDATFDGKLMVDLTAGEGHAAIAAVRQDCKP